MGEMKLVFKNVVQIFVFIVIMSRANSAKIPGKPNLSKIQQIPQYRFHYYLHDDSNGDYRTHEEYKNEDKSLYNVADSKGDVRIVNYRIDKSTGLKTDVNTETGSSPFKISLNNPEYNSQFNTSKKSTVSSKVSPIVVEPIIVQEEKSSKSIETDSKDEYHLVENVEKPSQIIEQLSTNQTEDRKDDVKDEQVTDQVIIQDDGITVKQTDFTIPFKKPNTENANNFKYNDEETMKKDIIKVIQNINENHEQSDPQLHFKSEFSDKPLKIVGADSMESERQENYQPSHGNTNSIKQQLSNKPLRLIGYNPSTFGSLYDMHVDYKQSPQIPQSPNHFNHGYSVGFGAHGDNVNSQVYDSSGVYFSQPSSTIQNGNYKGNQNSNAPTNTLQLYYYDQNSMTMLPAYPNMVKVENKPQPAYPIVQNKPQPAYPIVENKPQSAYSIVDSSKNGFNLMQILSGGSFYKGSEQTEGFQQMTVKDPVIKQESNKLEKFKPSETYDRSKPPQTVMFYLNPSETQIDLKSLTSSPAQQLTFGQQPQADCNSQKLKTTAGKSDKHLQSIPACSDCIPTLGIMGLQSAKSTTVQQKKSTTTPQVMPIWNGQNMPKLNYLILPNPITK